MAAHYVGEPRRKQKLLREKWKGDNAGFSSIGGQFYIKFKSQEFCLFSTCFIFNLDLIWRKQKRQKYNIEPLFLQEFKILIWQIVPSFWNSFITVVDHI